jgi:hypothetical protein
MASIAAKKYVFLVCFGCPLTEAQSMHADPEARLPTNIGATGLGGCFSSRNIFHPKNIKLYYISYIIHIKIHLDIIEKWLNYSFLSITK